MQSACVKATQRRFARATSEARSLPLYVARRDHRRLPPARRGVADRGVGYGSWDSPRPAPQHLRRVLSSRRNRSRPAGRARPRARHRGSPLPASRPSDHGDFDREQRLPIFGAGPDGRCSGRGLRVASAEGREARHLLTRRDDVDTAGRWLRAQERRKLDVARYHEIALKQDF
jgi:hypothetical protein